MTSKALASGLALLQDPAKGFDSPQPVTNESDCLKFQDYRNQAGRISSTIINGVRFATLSRDGAAAGLYSTIQLFRTFRHDRCYELGTAVSATSSGYMDDDYASGRVKRFEEANSSEVEKVLNTIPRSFRFLK